MALPAYTMNLGKFAVSSLFHTTMCRATQNPLKFIKFCQNWRYLFWWNDFSRISAQFRDCVFLFLLFSLENAPEENYERISIEEMFLEIYRGLIYLPKITVHYKQLVYEPILFFLLENAPRKNYKRINIEEMLLEIYRKLIYLPGITVHKNLYNWCMNQYRMWLENRTL